MPVNVMCCPWKPFSRGRGASQPHDLGSEGPANIRRDETPPERGNSRQTPATSLGTTQAEASRTDDLDEPHTDLPHHPLQKPASVSTPSTLRDQLWGKAYGKLEDTEPKIVAAYEKILSRGLNAGEFTSTSLQSQEDEIKQNAENRYDQMKRFISAGQEKTKKVDGIKKNIGEATRIIGSVRGIMDRATQAEPHTAVAWVGVCLVLEILRNPITESAAHRDGLTYVASRIEWYSELYSLLLAENTVDNSSSQLRDQLEERIVGLLSKYIAYQMKSVCMYYRGRGITFLRDLVQYDNWDGALKDIKEAETAVVQDSETYNTQSIRSNLEFLANTGRNIEEGLKGIRSDLQDQLKWQQDTEDEKQRNDCLRALFVTDPREDKERIEREKGNLLKEAYKWVLDNDSFRSWQQDKGRSLLWISADPGKGKTMLLCGIIDELESSSHDTNLSYFFCQANNTSINNVAAVVRSLIHRLIDEQPSLASHVLKRYETTGERLFNGLNADGALSGIFKDILHDPNLKPTYLIIDALDECVTGLDRLLELIVGSAPPHVKWIVSSRDITDIKEGISKAEKEARLHLDLNENSPPEAVTSYINYKVNRLAEEKRYAPTLMDEVRRHLVDNAQGTFLWVALVCQQLAGVEKRHVQDELRRFPSGLYAVYKRMVDQIDDLRDKDLCKRILAIVSTVYRPITFKELAVLAQPPKHYDSEDFKEVIKSCGSMLNTQNDMVSFVHKSAKDYLLDKASDKLFPSGIAHQHREILTRSLDVMRDTLRRDIYILQKIGLSINEIESARKDVSTDPLASVRYSCVHWINHFCDSYHTRDSENQNELVENSVDRFFQQRYLYWLEALSLMRHMGDGILSLTTLRNLAKEQLQDQQLVGIVEDSYRFIRQNRWVIENYPLQVYASALIFSPTESMIRKQFSNEEPDWIRVKPIVEKTWSPCQQTLEGHGSSVESVAFSPDSKLVASGSYDKTVKIWEAATGALQQTLEGHGDWVQSVAFSPDSKLVASGSYDGTVKIWDTATGALQQTLKGHGSLVQSVAFSPDSKLVASGSYDGTVKIWEAATGALQQTLEGHGDWVESVTFSPDSKLEASGSYDKAVRVWDVTTGALRQMLEGHGSSVESVAFSPDSKLVASGSSDKTVKIWDATTGALQQTLEGHGSSVWSVAFSPDSKLVASGSYDNTVKIWEAATVALQQTLEGHGDWVQSVTFSPDSKLLASSSTDSTVKIWDTATGALQQTLERHVNSVESVAFSPDLKLLASGFNDNTVKIWDVTTGALQHILEGHGSRVLSVAFSPDSKLVASGSWDKTVKIWEAATGALQQTLEGHGDWVQSVAFSPDSKLVASGSYDGTVKIWDTATGALQQTLKGHGSSVQSVAFSPDSKLVASGSSDKTVKIWEAITGALQQTLQGHNGSVTSVFSSSDSGPYQIRPHTYSITSDNSWVSWNGQKVLWLPPGYRNSCSDISSLISPIVKIALGMPYGRVIIIGFQATGPGKYL